MQDDEPPPAPDVELERALEAWTPQAPPADFADRVLAARDAAAPPHRHRRLPLRLIGGLAAAAAAVALGIVIVRPPHRAAIGTLVARERTTAVLGDRGIAVAEPAAELAWHIDDHGVAELVQSTGNVFYRVERGEAFVVHTPAGDVRVTGTCFRVEVTPMTSNQKLLLAGLVGAALATTVLVTVYEGHVVAETRSARTELAPGASATLGGDASGTILAGATLATPSDDAHATREQLLARARQQEIQLITLRTRLAQLERTAGATGAEAHDGPEPGRMWHDPSPDRLAAWVADCHIRSDEPSLDRFSLLKEADTERGIQASEVDGYNAAMGDMAKQWKDLVRGLYVETTGDAAGADTLSVEAMRREIEDKSPRGEAELLRQRLAQERAGLAAPPADPSKTSPFERLLRAFMQLGDQSEAALAKHLGAERAHAIRGEGWGSRSDSSGCPSTGSGH
jgi:hypothetical protein